MPFKNKEEKRQYILEHRDFLEALGIELTDEKIQEIVDDESRYADYQEELKNAAARADKDKASDGFFGEMPGLTENKMARLPRGFYDNSKTPEAYAKNLYLKTVVDDPVNGTRKFADMCVKALLDFDDTLLTKDSKEIEKYQQEHPAETFFLFGGLDFAQNLKSVYDESKPEDAAILRAVQNKFLALTTIEALKGLREFKGSKLYTIIPKDIKDDVISENGLTLMALGIDYNAAAKRKLNAAKKKADEDPTMENRIAHDKEKANYKEASELGTILRGLGGHTDKRNEFINYRNECQEMLAKKIIGPEGIYHRAYRMENGQKKYLTTDEVMQAYKTDAGKAEIEVEEISAEDRAAIDKVRTETPAFGKLPPLWENEKTKRQYATAIRTALSHIGYTMTDEEYDNIITDTEKEKEVLLAQDLRDTLQQGKFPVAIDPIAGIADRGRLVGGLMLKGDSPEVKEWNESVEVLAQSRAGLSKLAAIAAKKLLSIDMDRLTDTDIERRTQYLLDHPVERQIGFIADNVLNAYETSLPKDKRANDPILAALIDRKKVLENIQGELAIATCNASRELSLIPKLTQEQRDMLIAVGLPNALKQFRKDPEMAKAVKAIQDIITPYNQAEKIKEKPKDRQVLRDLYTKGTLKDDNLYKRAYLLEETKTATGETVTNKHYYNMGQVAEIIAANSSKEKEFKFESISKADRAAIDKFMAETPDKVEFDGPETEKSRLRQMQAIRATKEANNELMKEFAGQKRMDQTLDPELRELYANAYKAASESDNSVALANAFKYVNEHRDYSRNPVEQEKLEVALTTIAMLDERCVKELVNRINLERQYGGLFSKPTIDLDKVMQKSGITPSDIVDKKLFNYRDPFDKRIQNVKEIYDHLKNDLDPWHHVNGEKFETMMQTMKNALDYASTTRSTDSRTMEAMLKEITAASKEYALEKDAARTLGQNRRSAALAIVAALDPKEGEQLLAKAQAEKKWVGSVVEKLNVQRDLVTTRDFMQREMLTESLNKTEVLMRMDADIKRSKEEGIKKIAQGLGKNPSKAELDAAVAKSAELDAEIIVKERIYNSIKGNVIDHRSVIADMSKHQVKEAGGKILKDDVYRSVVDNMKINQPSELDKAIDKIETEYIKAKVWVAKDQLQAEEKAHQAENRENQKNRENPEIEGRGIHV